MAHAKTREATVKMLDMMDEGVLDARAVADMCLSWMSEDSVADMLRANDILDTEEKEWSADTCDFNDPGSRHHY